MTDQIRTTVVLNDGQPMPQFARGVFQTSLETTAQVIKMTVDEGYRAVDRACMSRNEEGVGKALEGRSVMLGSFGVGAVIGALNVSKLRSRLEAEARRRGPSGRALAQ